MCCSSSSSRSILHTVIESIKWCRTNQLTKEMSNQRMGTWAFKWLTSYSARWYTTSYLILCSFCLRLLKSVIGWHGHSICRLIHHTGNSRISTAKKRKAPPPPPPPFTIASKQPTLAGFGFYSRSTVSPLHSLSLVCFLISFFAIHSLTLASISTFYVANLILYGR